MGAHLVGMDAPPHQNVAPLAPSTHATMRALLIPSLALLALAKPLGAQQPDERLSLAPPSYIAVSSEGVVSVTPDRATVRVAVVTRASTASEAGSMNAERQRAVIDAVRALGIPAAQIGTSGYTLQPEMRYLPNRTPEVTGYAASNTVTVRLMSIDQAGGVIDAALAHGANQVSGLTFEFSGAEGARREAITKAVERARLDAEAAARGAGQALGRLLSVDVGAPIYPRAMMLSAVAVTSSQAAPTPIEAGTQEVRVMVSAKWAVRQ